MWIRSQDKQILGDFNFFKLQRNLRNYAICTNSVSDVYILGEYDNFNTALSVLDNLQDLLNNETKSIFQMPN